jgi:ribosomal protein S18 acetylase RimI-like enzyme
MLDHLINITRRPASDPAPAPRRVLHLRVMNTEDEPQILPILRACFPHVQYSEHVLEAYRCSYQRIVARLSEDGQGYGTLVGFAIYGISRNSLGVQFLGVAPEHRRKHVGGAMWDAISRLMSCRRNRAGCRLRESNAVGAAFLSRLGFRATLTRGAYRDPDEDAYDFTFRADAGGR